MSSLDPFRKIHGAFGDFEQIEGLLKQYKPSFGMLAFVYALKNRTLTMQHLKGVDPNILDMVGAAVSTKYPELKDLCLSPELRADMGDMRGAIESYCAKAAPENGGPTYGELLETVDSLRQEIQMLRSAQPAAYTRGADGLEQQLQERPGESGAGAAKQPEYGRSQHAYQFPGRAQEEGS